MLPEPLSSALITAAPRSGPGQRGTTIEDSEGAGRSFAEEVAEDPAETADAAEGDPAAVPAAGPGWNLADLQLSKPAGTALAQLPTPPEAGTPAITPPIAAERNGAAALAVTAAVAGAVGFRAAAVPAAAGGTAPPTPAPSVAASPVLMPTALPDHRPAPDAASVPAAMPASAATPIVAAADPEAPRPGMETYPDPALSRAPAATQPQAGPPGTERPAPSEMLPAGAPVQPVPAGTPRRDAGAVQPESEVTAGATPAAARSPQGRHPVTADGADPKRVLADVQVTVGDAGPDRGGLGAGPDGAGAAVSASERSLTLAPGTADPPRAGELRPAAPQPLGTQIVDGIRQARDGSVELSLSPEELGRVRLTLHGGDASLHVTIQADRPETESLLRRHIGLLQQEFRDLGYGGISFDFGPRQDRPAPFADGAGGAAPLAETERTAAVAEAAPTPWAPILVPGRGLDLRL